MSISLHLATYCMEVLRKKPTVPRGLLAHVGFELEKRAHGEGWDMTEAEHAWILQKVKDTLAE